MGRGRPADPGIVASLGHAEHARHGGDRETGPVRAHEPEEPDDTAPVSRANQAAAFERMSRTNRSCLFSRRSLANSSCSEATKLGLAFSRGPSCLSADETHAPLYGAVVRTPVQDPRETVPHGPDQPSGGKTQVNMAGEFWPSGAPLVKASGCPPNRVNPSPDGNELLVGGIRMEKVGKVLAAAGGKATGRPW